MRITDKTIFDHAAALAKAEQSGIFAHNDLVRKARKKTRIHVMAKDSGELDKWLQGKRVIDDQADLTKARYQEFKQDGSLARFMAEHSIQGKPRFSRTAGCSCGCSPGFIVEGDVGKEIFIDVAPDAEIIPFKLRAVK